MTQIFKTNYNSILGKLTLAADEEENLVGLWIEEQKYFASSLSGEIVEDDSRKIFEKTKLWLDKYFNGEKPKISELSLAPKGSEFRQEVWKILCEIPYGEVITYGDIANQIAKRKGIARMSARAVGGAVGHNPISIIIPCHRVIGANGNLTGYAGGLDIKIKLLRHENLSRIKI